jgi:excisionase family DNA binding protein
MTAPVTWTPSAAAALERLEGRLFAKTPEVAAVLRCDVRTLRKAIAAGEIPAVRVGPEYRIPTAWLREKAQLTTAGGDGSCLS